MRTISRPWRRTPTDEVAPDSAHAQRLANLAAHSYELTTDAWESTPRFRFADLADAVAKCILDSPPQLTLAVYGDWGTGNTTLLHAIGERVRSDRCAVAWLDMWDHKDMPSVVPPLLDAIASAIERRGGAAVATKLREFARAALASATISAGHISFSDAGFLTELDKVREQPRPAVASLKRALEPWLSEGQERRIMVVVDNLDRCLPKTAIDLIEQLSTLFGFPGVIFVLAADKDRLVQAASDTYNVDGGTYLAIIVQVEFPLPRPLREDVADWVRDLSGDLHLEDEEIDLLAEVAQWNPRTIKRLLNNTRMQLWTAQHD